ncbi:chondroitinase-B domain-containing protein [Persicobacter psychrovividus]|uniref:F5/8 type C domain-containing protein n=1 Tax=Persicobacter psychrovividus TaxID=387638 RepID=A0ABM7VAT4_9BACT|nr:hypothetical protein PEPS_00850 [Persicobacter psychrovividus]
MKSTPIFVLFGLLFSLNAWAETTIVDNRSDMRKVLAAAVAGDTIIVKSGTYADLSASSIEIQGTAEKPIVFMAEEVGGVKMSGNAYFSFRRSEHVIIQGFTFNVVNNTTMVKLEGCNNMRVTQNVFELTPTEEGRSVKWLIIQGVWDDKNFEHESHHNRIDHNIFQNKTTPGHYITIDGTNNKDNENGDPEEYRQSQYDRIDHNYFRNNGPRAVNEQESIRIGWSEMSMSSGFTTVEFNRFENCDGDPEVVSVKSCDNTIRHNTFVGCYGVLSLRHGNRNHIEGNYFFGGGRPTSTSPAGANLGTGGIRIYGTDHVVINNYFQGLNGNRWDAPITITKGDAIDGQDSKLNKHFIAQRVVIANNTLVDNEYGIELGFDNNGNYPKSIEDITLANNLIINTTNDPINFYDDSEHAGIDWSNNLVYPQSGSEMTNSESNISFADAEVKSFDPQLALNDSLYFSTANTPDFDNLRSIVNLKDIHGQDRGVVTTVGADQYSTGAMMYHPMRPQDVGPTGSLDNEVEDKNYINISEPNTLPAAETSIEIMVYANVQWTASTDSDWLTIDKNSGDGDATITLTASANDTDEQRSAVLTLTDGEISTAINIQQEAPEIPANSELAEIKEVYASSEETAKGNTADKTIDDDFGTLWASNGKGEHITYDLGEEMLVNIVQIAFNKANERTSYFDLAGSTDGETFDIILANQESQNTLEQTVYPFNQTVRYVRIIGQGNSSNDWNTITEVDIYKQMMDEEEEEDEDDQEEEDNDDAITSTPAAQQVRIYPNPVQDHLNFENLQGYDQLILINMEGRQVFHSALKGNHLSLPVFPSGMYILKLIGNEKTHSQKIIIR